MKQATIRLSDSEMKHLQEYCRLTERTQNDVLRDCVRRLRLSGALNPIEPPAILPDAHSGE